ncbi:MAG: hypothetical protein K0R50_2106 [Eubacterium sp.]|nr:hypothetical protein [Eubacterium sp.]
MELYILEYYQLYQLEFLGTIEETFLTGNFVWDEVSRQKFSKINEIEENEEEQGKIWYLDRDGYRLDDNELFKNSPWSIIKNGIRKKAIMRFLMEDGSAAFWIHGLET